jgi:L-threonylcarbamoyladenylate synthase
MEGTKTVWDNPELVKTIKSGGVAVMPTDTLYGIVGDALNTPTVNRIYSLRHRSPEKPCIILIGSMIDLEKLSIQLSEIQKKAAEPFWPGPVSIIFDCHDADLAYLHRGTDSLAIRFPAIEALQKFLRETGPIIAPSANTEGQTPSQNIDEAKKYFGNSVFYADGGMIAGKASKIIRIGGNGEVTVIRE